jgi:hypothetical protein
VLGEVRTFAGAAGPGVRRVEYERISGLGAGAEAMVPIDQIVGTVEPHQVQVLRPSFPAHLRSAPNAV